jgi:GT2 family glycosyltransferase
VACEGWLASIAAALGGETRKCIIGGDVRILPLDPNRLTQLEAYECIFAYRQEEYIRKFGFSGTGNLAVRRADFDVIGPFGGIEIAEDREWGRRAQALGYAIEYCREMIVYHPARTTFSQIEEKWDRHIDHDRADVARLHFSRARWMFFAIAVALSPAFELHRIATSSRVRTMRDRFLATTALIRIRLYRAQKMITGAISDSRRGSQSWNRN